MKHRTTTGFQFNAEAQESRLPPVHIQVRIISMDYYMDKPLINLDASQVPVIRIFGDTIEGTKCL